MNKTAKYASIISLIAVMLLTSAFVMAGKKECNNGQDDDGDGAIDLADAGCNNKGDNDESNCGDGVCEGGETTATCSADCAVCGNNIQEGSETCDGTDLAGETCVSQGFDGGDLGCQSGCGAFDTSNCYINTCSDTDSGFDVLNKGIVSGETDEVPFSHTDSCSGTTLTEWRCVGTTPTSSPFECTGNFTGCTDGACTI